MALVNLDRVPYPEPATGVLNVTSAKKIVNGNFVAVNGMVANTDSKGNERYNIEKLAEGCVLGIVAEPFHPYTAKEEENDMEFKKDDIVRFYFAKRHEAYTVSKADCIDGSVAVGDKLKVLANDFKLTKDTTGAGIAVVRRIYNFNGQESVLVEIL